MKDKPWCWILVHLVFCWKWDIKHRGPWESNEPVPLCNPELKTHIGFGIYCSNSIFTKRWNHWWALLPFYNTCPSVFLLQFQSKQANWKPLLPESLRATEPSLALRLYEFCILNYIHKTLANGTRYKNFESCQYFKEHMLKTWLLTLQNLACNTFWKNKN